MMTFSMELEIQVQVEGNVTKGTPSRFSPDFGNYLPGEPDDVDARVFLVRSVRNPDGTFMQDKLDITEWLAPEELEEVEDEVLGNIQEEL